MYAIKVLNDGRITCATYAKYAVKELLPELQECDAQHEYTQDELMEGYILADSLPGENLADYRYVDGEFILDPLPEEQERCALLDVIEAQITYTAMMTDTLLEV